MTQPVFAPQLSTYTQRSIEQIPVRQGLVAAGLTACGILLRNYSSFLAYPLYALGGIAGLRGITTWINEPRFRMTGEVNGQNPNEGVRKLYQDMLNCGIAGDNYARAAERYTAYAPKFGALDSDAQNLLRKIETILRGGNTPRAETFVFHLERLYLELALQNGAATDEQKKTYTVLAALLQPHQDKPQYARHLALLTSLGHAINRGSSPTTTSTNTFAFELRSLLVQIQGKDHSHGSFYHRYQDLCRFYDTVKDSSFPLKTEAHADLCAITALILPARINTTTSQPRTTTVSLPAAPASRETTPSARPAVVSASTRAETLPPSSSTQAARRPNVYTLASSNAPKISAFNAWVDGNPHFANDRVKGIVKNTYACAIQLPESAQRLFNEWVDHLAETRQITGRNAHHCKAQFNRLQAPAVTSSATPVATPVGPFDASAWATEYTRLSPTLFSSQAVRSHQNNMLRALGQETKRAAVNGYTVNGRAVRLDPTVTQGMQQGTKLYAATTPLPDPSTLASPVTVQVVNMDTFDAGHALKGAGYNPVVINMANEHTAGGGFEGGARAQEENLFRRSNYFQSLYLTENAHLSQQMRGTYHIPQTGVVYTPHLQVFRGNEADGYPFLDQPRILSAIAVAAYDLNPGHGPNGRTIDPRTAAYSTGMKEKIKSFLRAAILEGHDAVVLGALGCGAFRNNPRVVAQLFRDVLEESNEFVGRFRQIQFAVINDHNSNGNSNYDAFRDILHGLTL